MASKLLDQLKKTSGADRSPTSQGRLDKVGKLLYELRRADQPLPQPASRKAKELLRTGAKPTTAARILCGAAEGLGGDLAACAKPVKKVKESRSAAAQKEGEDLRYPPKKEKAPLTKKAKPKKEPASAPPAAKEKAPKIEREQKEQRERKDAAKQAKQETERGEALTRSAAKRGRRADARQGVLLL
jgi:outer membrane biosynthesis protein TonB